MNAEEKQINQSIIMAAAYDGGGDGFALTAKLLAGIILTPTVQQVLWRFNGDSVRGNGSRSLLPRRAGSKER